RLHAGAAGAGAVDPGAGGAGDTVRPRPYFPASPLPAPSPYTKQSGGLTERREPASRPVSPVRTARRTPRLRPPPVPGTHAMALRPSSVPLRVPLPAPPESSHPAVPDPESDSARAASPSVCRLLATTVTDPSFESAAASALVAELLDFAVACRLDYATALVAESVSASPPSVGGECALGTDVLEDRQEDFECLAATVPRFASMLLAPEGDPDAPDIPTPRSYAEAITGTYVDEVPPPGANIVDGMWIFRVKRPPGSPPAFKACYVARGFSQRQGVDYFQTFSPTPKMTNLRVLLHVAAQRDYELHSLDFSTAFLQARVSRSAAPRITHCCSLHFAPCCSQRVAPCCPARRAVLQPARCALLQLAHRALLQPACRTLLQPAPPPSRPATTTAATATRATTAAGGGAAGSAGSAAGAGGAGDATGSAGGAAGAGDAGPTTDLPLPDDPTPQQLCEWVLQRARPGGGGFGFLRTAQRGQHSQRETFSPQVLSELFPQRCVIGSVEAAALGASESAVALGASESAAALGAGESAAASGTRASPATGPSSAEALHTFTLDSSASRCFFCDCTTLTPLAAPVPVSLTDSTGGPVVARASTILLCPAVPSGSLSGLHLPTFSTNLVSNAAIQDVWVDTFIPGGQCVTICTCSWTGQNLATFTRWPRSSLYTMTTAFAQVAEAGQVAASIQVSASGQLAAS
ncbi:unnamed protein product, partial [Closterium sp. NIES-54]